MMARNLVVCSLAVLLGLTAGAQRLRAADLACLTCHSAPGFRQAGIEGKEKSLFVDADLLAASAHKGKRCVDCHADFQGQKMPHKQSAEPVDCARCHHNGNQVGAPDHSHIDMYADSVHGDALRKGDPDAPACKTCHGTHDIRPASNSKSTICRENIPKTCGKCHFDAAFNERHKLLSVKSFTDSVHARVAVLKNRLKTAAVCTDCHGVHDIRAPKELASSVSRSHLPSTCGGCHKEVLKQYEASIHGKAAAKGVKSAPVCNDCHGEHLIMAQSQPESPVYPTHVVATCSKCHENIKIQRKYGLPANRLSSYISSYHGVANKYGDITVANCSTCHGAHDVLPSSDPKSAISKKNLPTTCGKCHPGASKNFAVGSIHVVPTPKHDAVVFWVRAFYMLFVVGLIGSFCGYIILDLRARWIGRLPWRRGGHQK
ncbi:MAG: hypothetical protein M1133_15515 [Armatimonadetes bacterium]|nr:hypothetical protein [Armatimonadota bacterium]